jgi:hypothetical protein
MREGGMIGGIGNSAGYSRLADTAECRTPNSADRLADAGDSVTDLVNGIARLLSTVSPRPETAGDSKGPRPVPTLGAMLEALPKHIAHESERGHALLNELRATLGL